MNKQTHRTVRSVVMKLALAAALVACGGLAGADEGKGTLHSPWKAQGKVYGTGPNTLMFVGEIEGTLYAESGKGIFDAARMICPMLYELDVLDGTTRSEGRCAIRPKEGADVIYATYACQGQIGTCAGRLEITGGTGKYDGMSGSGAMTSRTGAGEMAIRMGPGGGISNAEGLMTMTGFSCKTR